MLRTTSINCARMDALEALDYLLWQARQVYNAALEQRINIYKRPARAWVCAQWAHFRDLRHERADTLGRLNATCLQQMLRRLDKAFAAFFRRVKKERHLAFPASRAATASRVWSSPTATAASCGSIRRARQFLRAECGELRGLSPPRALKRLSSMWFSSRPLTVGTSA